MTQNLTQDERLVSKNKIKIVCSRNGKKQTSPKLDINAKRSNVSIAYSVHSTVYAMFI